MSANSKMKQISLEKLEDSSSKVTSAKIKRIGILGVTVFMAAIGGYLIYGLLSGSTIASRFTVNSMNCPACVITVREVTTKMPGVVETDVSLASQSVTVKFQEKRATADNIGQAIANVGYQVKYDGTYKPDLPDNRSFVIAGVNNRPMFKSDLQLPLAVDPEEVRKRDVSESFFSNVGKELILQAADKAIIVAQPQEVEDEIKNILERQTLKEEEFLEWIKKNFVSIEKFKQIIAQRLAVQKFLDETGISEIEDNEVRKNKTLEMLGNLFKDADVRIYDGEIREKIHAKVGQDDWKTFWPRMLSVDTELKSLVLGRNSNASSQIATEKTSQN